MALLKTLFPQIFKKEGRKYSRGQYECPTCTYKSVYFKPETSSVIKCGNCKKIIEIEQKQ